jgi:hypothetical protein
MKTTMQMLCVLVAAVYSVACNGQDPRPSERVGQIDEAVIQAPQAEDVFGFERSGTWTSSQFQLAHVSTAGMQGSASLRVQGSGYGVIQSSPLANIASPTSTVKVDLKLPVPQPNPYWYGTAQLFVESRSLGLFNHYIGQVELTGLPKGSFRTLTFTLPQDVQQKLATPYHDLVFRFALNIPSGTTEPWFLDRVQFGSGSSGTGSPAALDILGCENSTLWSSTGLTLSGTSTRTQGAAALAMQGSGYTTFESAPIGTIEQPTQTILLDLRLPLEQPDPGWFGTLALHIHAPSLGLDDVLIAQRELTGLAADSFHRLAFELPAAVFQAIQGKTYFDLRLRAVLNVPTGAPRTYVLDNIRFGEVLADDRETKFPAPTGPVYPAGTPETQIFEDELTKAEVIERREREAEFIAKLPLAVPPDTALRQND